VAVWLKDDTAAQEISFLGCMGGKKRSFFHHPKQLFNRPSARKGENMRKLLFVLILCLLPFFRNYGKACSNNADCGRGLVCGTPPCPSGQACTQQLVCYYPYWRWFK